MAAIESERRHYTLPEFLALAVKHDRLPRGKKFRGYQDYGVRVYWLVDTQRRTITTYGRQGDKLIETAVLHPGDTLRCSLFPELGVPVERLFVAP